RTPAKDALPSRVREETPRRRDLLAARRRSRQSEGASAPHVAGRAHAPRPRPLGTQRLAVRSGPGGIHGLAREAFVKVLHVINTLERAGAETLVADLTVGLARRGIESEVYLLRSTSSSLERALA